jgi:hypothetical protein
MDMASAFTFDAASKIKYISLKNNPQTLLFKVFEIQAMMANMAIRVVEFSKGGYKIRKIFP